MADTRFTDASGNQAGTLVQASWLNDVNTNTYTILSAVAGTNAVTGNGASTVTVGYPRGVAFRFIPQNTNITAVTINISALGVKNVTKYGTTPLVAGDLVAGSWAFITYDGTQFQLLNPLSVATNVTGRLINTQTFTASGTYTPTAGTTSIIVKAVGGGGGGGGSTNSAAGALNAAGGGGGGGYTEGRFTTGFSGAAVTIGAGGAAGAAPGNGGNGGVTSLGGLITANGGLGGIAGSSAPTAAVIPGAGAAVSATGGNILALAGNASQPYIIAFIDTVCIPCKGASGPLSGNPTISSFTTTAITGSSPAAGSYGSGASGAATFASNAGQVGAVGASGILIIYEYS